MECRDLTVFSKSLKMKAIGSVGERLMPAKGLLWHAFCVLTTNLRSLT